MDISEEDFLEHYGVKGMKWGVRKAARKEKRAAKKAAWDKRSTRQKVGIASAAAGSAFVVANLVAGKTMNLPLAVVTGTLAGTAGQRFVERRLDRED